LLIRIISSAFFIAFSATVFFTNAADAQTAAKTSASANIVVLDIGKIRRDAVSVKSIREQIISYQNKLQGEIQKEQEALRTAQQELAKKQTLLAPEAFADERHKFEQKVVGVQQMVEDRRRSLEQTQTDAMLQVENALNEIIASEVEKKHYDIILRFSQVVFVKNAYDITDEVLIALDKKLPTVKVVLPKK
jgi:outer membrane protein